MNALLNYWRSFGRISRDVRLWVLSWACNGFGFQGTHAVLLNLYLLRIGYRPDFIGLLGRVGQLAVVAVALPGAALGTRIGHRNAMLIGVPLYSIASMLTLLAEDLPGAVRTPWLSGSSILFWLGASLYAVNSAPYLMGATTGHERRYALASQQAADTTAGFLGALIAGWLPGYLVIRLGAPPDSATPYRLSLALAPVIFLLGAVALLRTRPERAIAEGKVQVESVTGQAPLRLLLYVGTLVFVVYLGFGVTSFVNLYLDEVLAVPTVQIGTLMAVARLAPLALAVVIPLILGRWGAGTSLLGSVGCTALALIALALMPRLSMIGVAYVATVVANRVILAARTLLSQEAVAPNWRGTMVACVPMGNSLAMAAASAAGGYLIVAAGYRSLFLAAAGASLVAAGMLSLYLRRQARRPAVALTGSGDSPIARPTVGSIWGVLAMWTR